MVVDMFNECGGVTALPNSTHYNYIPVDFIKANIVGVNVNDLFSNQSLEYTPELDKDELKSYVLEHENMKLKFYVNPYNGNLNSAILSGSLHKFHNEGLHNYNVFTHSMYNQSLYKLYDAFNLYPHNVHLTTQEYGFNITPPIKTNNVLDGFKLHKRVEFTCPIKYVRGYFLQAMHQDYFVKAYNKAIQYDVDGEIFRFEIKNKRLTKFRECGVNTLLDFNNANKRMYLEDLIQRWNEIVMYDYGLKQLDINHNYNVMDFWRGLMDRVKSRELTSSGFKYHTDKLKEMNKTQGLNIQAKMIELFYLSMDEVNDLTNYEVSTSQCRLTGLDITSQRSDSFLLSHTGLRYLFLYDSVTFQQLQNKFLTTKWINEPLEVQIREIAHGIRNAFNNRQKRIIPNQFSLELSTHSKVA